MKHLMIFIVALGALFLAQNAAAQATPPQRDANGQTPQERAADQRREEARRRMDRLAGKDENGMIADRGDFRRGLPPRTKPDGKPYTREEIKQIEALKRPNEADLAQYASFLKQSKTGIFRLFPYLQCAENPLLIRVDGDCAGYVPESWSYSFRDDNGPYFTKYFDLKYRDENLVTGSRLSLGVLTLLGDVPLEKVALTSDGMKFLADLKPETAQAENINQIKSFVQGVEAGGYKYSSKVKIEENKTYGLRVVAYRMPGNVRLVIDERDARIFRSYPINKFDERDDIIVAFRIVRKEADGNITIVWKELSRTDAPKLVFPKDVKHVLIKDS